MILEPDIERGTEKMLLFNCDYNEGCHPRLLEALTKTNYEQTIGYGEDEYCKKAGEAIKKACDREDIDVHFLVGGTQANLTVIDSALRSHQGVVCVKEGHINVHETGSIEACGHKVLALEGADGKICAEQIEACHREHWADGSREHMVQPKMVYLSHPTELGTLYSLAELEAIRKVCDECGLYLFVDGARLGYGLMAEGSDVSLADLARLCDVFYIGGTKMGALFGEAVVIKHSSLKEDFRYFIKQKGGMLAKGRLLGLQFYELFRDGLYFELGAHADRLAMMIKSELSNLGYRFFVDSVTNQQFVIVPDNKLEKLKDKYLFSYQQRYDDTHSVVRICTSWATKEEDVRELLSDMK